MNRTKIEWTDYTWNPVTGCWGPGGMAEKPNRCAYCYANRLTKRFNRETSLVFDDTHECGEPGYNDPFRPHFYPDRLDQPGKVKKPTKIFVCSMGDLFGDWVPDEWITEILDTVRGYAWHTYQFLTKNPQRLHNFNPWPKNSWVGTTITNQADADERLPWLLQVDVPVTFVSHEPLMGATDMRKAFIAVSWGGFASWGKLKWGIVGAMTGMRAVKPQSEWVMDLVDQYQQAGVPIFLKNNLVFKYQPQEFPD